VRTRDDEMNIFGVILVEWGQIPEDVNFVF
jgi:hypothetical protein